MYVFRPFFFSLFFFSRPIVFFLRIHFVGYHINLFTSRLPPSADVTTGHFTSCSVTASLLVTERVAAVARTRTQRILTPTHTHSVYYSHTYTHTRTHTVDRVESSSRAEASIYRVRMCCCIRTNITDVT